MSDHASSSTVTQIAQNSVFERLARAGYIVSGLLHLAIGYLAIRIALGSGAGSADQSGALAAVAAKPGGIAALWVAVVALVVMGLWRLVETALGRSTDPKAHGAPSEVLDREKAFALAVVYFAFAYSTFGFARGAGKSTGAQNSGMSARLMRRASHTTHPRSSWRRRSRSAPTCAMRRTASSSCGPQSHRSLPRTSRVKHSRWIRTSGGALQIRRHRRRLGRRRDAPGVGESFEGVDQRGRAESVNEPQRQHDPGTDRRRGHVPCALLQFRSK